MAATTDELDRITTGLFMEHGKPVVKLATLMARTQVLGSPAEIGDLMQTLACCFHAYMREHNISPVQLLDAQAALVRSRETIAILEALTD